MEGIQHRDDCPVAKGALHDNPTFVHLSGTIRTFRAECPYCHRAALIQRPLPKETSDE